MQEKKGKTSPIKGRILEYAEKKGISKTSLCSSISVSYENFKGRSLSSELGGDAIGRILSVYSDLNAEWLITGEGSMIKDQKKSTLSQSIMGDNNTMSGHDTLTQGGDNIIELYKKIIEEKEEQIRIKDEQIKKLLDIISLR